MPNSNALQKLVDVNKGADKQIARFFLIPLNPTTGEPLGKNQSDPKWKPIRLPFWPETLDYSRGSIGWQETEIPGLSHPLLQWTQNGAPELSFEAVFAADRDPAYNASSNSQFEALKRDSPTPYDVNINGAMAWFQGMSNPRYKVQEEGKEKAVESPPVIQIVPEYLEPASKAEAQGNRAGSPSGDQNETNPFVSLSDRVDSGISLSHMLDRDFFGVLTEFNITYEESFPSGKPRYATVSLGFKETIQLGDTILPHDRDDNLQVAKNYELTQDI